MPAWATKFIGPNEMKPLTQICRLVLVAVATRATPVAAVRLLDAIVHEIKGAGPGRLEVTPEMQQGAASNPARAWMPGAGFRWDAHLRVLSYLHLQADHDLSFGGVWSSKKDLQLCKVR